MRRPRSGPGGVHLRSTDLRSIARLASDATLGVVGIVENVHHNIGRMASPWGEPSDRPTRGVTGLVYRTIRGAVRAVGGGVDLLLQPVESLLSRREADGLSASGERETVVAALNGVIGDRLAASNDPLAIPMTLQFDGRPLELTRAPLALAIPHAKTRLLLLIHGLGMHPRQWQRNGSDPGLAMAEANGSTLIHLHYNTGIRIAANGGTLARLLERVVEAWPVALEEIAIVGHSMGGLVARSACQQAMARGDRWPGLLRTMVFLGTPHHGSPLERGGHLVDVVLGASPYTAALARIGRVRSAGIHDLRDGTLVEGDGSSGPPAHVALPAGVACFAVAGVLGQAHQRTRERLLGDGLVAVVSALGRHPDPSRTLAFEPDRQWTAHGVGHLGLLNDPAVVFRVAGWLRAEVSEPRSPRSPP